MKLTRIYTTLLTASLTSLMIIALLAIGCLPQKDKLASEIVLYDWEGDIPQSVLEKFEAEYGPKVRYDTYESQEEAIENISNGQVYDVVVVESRYIPFLIENGLAAKLNFENLANFKNISPNFRGLTYDPDNRYSIPYSWGVTGLLVRTDREQIPISRWGDLWNLHSIGDVAIWKGQPREVIALTLKSLGFSANSEDPAELQVALERLIALKPHLQFVEDYDGEYAAQALINDKILVAMGYSGDYQECMNMGLPVKFVMPEEGALLWGDNFVIPARSPNQVTAELFINFLLRPEISAEIVNQKYYASANNAALDYVNLQIRSDPSIYPDQSVLVNAEIILPLSKTGQELYNEIWEQFMQNTP